MRKSPPNPTRRLPGRPVWIDTPRQLEQLIKKLSNELVVAVDTESDSLYSYFEKVCLVQVSTAQTDYLVDPLNVDISRLATFFAASSIQKVFHAAEYDILSLKRDYNFAFVNLFDTMLAAKILGWQLGVARAVGAVVFAVITGLLMALIFRKDDTARTQGQIYLPDEEGKSGLYGRMHYTSSPWC